MTDERPTEPAGPLQTTGSTTPDRHLTLDDLPPAVAERLRFSAAAPKRLKSDELPAPVREELETLWDGIVADVYDEVAGVRRTKALGRERVSRALQRIVRRMLQAERVVIFAAVHHPVRWRTERRHVAVAAAGGGAAAAVSEIATLGTAGTATTVAIVSAVASEVFETYVAASVRTMQYRQQHWPADPNAVVLDLAEAAGYTESTGRRATTSLMSEAGRWLSKAIVTRTSTRFARGLIPAVGIAAGGGMAAANLQRVRKLPLRPPSEAALQNVVLDYLNDPEEYAREREAFRTLALEGAEAGADDQELDQAADPAPNDTGARDSAPTTEGRFDHLPPPPDLPSPPGS